MCVSTGIVWRPKRNALLLLDVINGVYRQRLGGVAGCFIVVAHCVVVVDVDAPAVALDNNCLTHFTFFSFRLGAIQAACVW